jgi:hypothetical protein
MDILQVPNSLSVTAADMAVVSDMAEAVSPAPVERRLPLLMAALHQRFGGNTQKVGTAMARYMSTCQWIAKHSPGLTLPKGAHASIPTQYAVFEAAAVHPLIQASEDVLLFEPDSFALRVLARSQAVGRS